LITRGQYNDITVTAKNPEDNATIKVSCNFTANCNSITYISGVVYDKPAITTINRPVFLRDATALSPFIITGVGFTASNTVSIFSNYTSKRYVLGSFPASGTTTISVDGNLLNQALQCGSGCLQRLPPGDYTVMVKNEGGESNTVNLSVKSYTTSTFSTQTGSVPPTSKNNKVATITITSSVELALTSLSLTSTTTSTTLAGKVSNFTLKDQLTGVTYGGGGGSFSINGDKLGAGQSKVYDIYVDTSAENIEDTGFITYGGTLLVRDPTEKIDMNIPIRDFSFTVSY
jgi:hypothetical protein